MKRRPHFRSLASMYTGESIRQGNTYNKKTQYYAHEKMHSSFSGPLQLQKCVALYQHFKQHFSSYMSVTNGTIWWFWTCCPVQLRQTNPLHIFMYNYLVHEIKGYVNNISYLHMFMFMFIKTINSHKFTCTKILVKSVLGRLIPLHI